MWNSIVAVSVGGTAGCLFRWWLGLQLNALFPTIPPGTLAANIIGGYIIGVAVGYFSASSVSPEWRLLIITGFCGGLTTFSTFSAEVVSLMQQGRMAWACAEITTHVVSSISMTFLGIATTTLFRAHE